MTRILCCVLVGWLAAIATPAAAEPLTPAAHELEAKLIAPCCWRETLDIHQSALADQLRREIRQRLAAGDAAATIEADLVARYGPKLRATLPGSLGYLLFGGFAISGLTILIGLAIRVNRQAAARTKVTTRTAPEARPMLPISDREIQKYEDKLDDDLATG